MFGYLIYDRETFAKNESVLKFYNQGAIENGFSLSTLMLEDITIKQTNDGIELYDKNNKIPYPDFVINRTRNYKLGEMLESGNIKVFNNSLVTRICNDKSLSYCLAKNLGYKIMPTYTYFGDIPQLNYNYPMVCKSENGHGGTEVESVANIETLKNLPFNTKLAQDMCDTLGQDLRLYILGNQIIAGVLRESKNNFKSNFSLGGKVSEFPITNKEIEMLAPLFNRYSFDFVGIDFIFHNREMYFNEIEDVVGARMLYNVTNIDILGKFCKYIANTIRARSKNEKNI